MKHICSPPVIVHEGLYGCAVSDIAYNETLGCWTVDNGEYMSYPIVACPFCGITLSPFMPPGQYEKE